VFEAGGAQGNQPPVSQQSQNVSTEQRIQNWVQLVEQNAPVEDIQKAEMEVAEALQKQPFEMRKQLPFFQKLVQKFDASKAFQNFKLPGRERVVEDRREQFHGEPKEAAKEGAKEAAKDAAKEAAKEESKKASLTLKDGKLIDKKDLRLAGAAALGARDVAMKGSDHEAAATRVDEMLSAFERMVVERFEKGKQIADQSADGKPHFKGKTEGEWKQFFKNFMSRTVQKKVLFDDIKQFLMRGVVAKGAKGVFIGDMTMNSGRVEKFVRFSIIAEALAKLRAMIPGDTVTKQMLGKLTGEELMYLALAASRGREFAFAQQAAQGRFGAARAEAQAAEALGIPLNHQLEQKARHLRGKKGGGMAWYEKDPAVEDTPYRFVPWWSWGNLSAPTPTRWITRVMYGALLIVSLIGIITLTVRLLAGG
jgi:hypothetical protein